MAKKSWTVHPTGLVATPIVKMGRINLPIHIDPRETVVDPDGFKRLISKDSCDGCKHLHFVQANPYGTSHSGCGCLMSGGHAVKRCQLFEEA